MSPSNATTPAVGFDTPDHAIGAVPDGQALPLDVAVPLIAGLSATLWLAIAWVAALALPD